MSHIESRLNKVLLDTIILRLLSEKDMYVYEMINHTENLSKGKIKLQDTSIYQHLNSLEQQSVIRSYWKKDTTDKMMPRKYYHIEEKGHKILIEDLEAWKHYLKVMKPILNDTLE